MWKDIWVLFQEREVVLSGFHVLAYKAMTPPGNKEADALAQI